VQFDRHLLAAHPGHQCGLVLHQEDAPLVDDADPVGHRLGLLEVMGRQDDGDAVGLELPHRLPHALAQFHVDPGGGFVEEQDTRFVRQRLGDQHPPLHAARQLHHLRVALVPERQLPQHPLQIGVVARLAEEPAGKADGVDHPLERLERDVLRHEPDKRPRPAVVRADVVPADRHPPARGRHQPADGRDQRRLPRPVRAEEREKLALPDRQGNAPQRLEAAGIDLPEVLHCHDVGHGCWASGYLFAARPWHVRAGVDSPDPGVPSAPAASCGET
jgi:hypothetical protein